MKKFTFLMAFLALLSWRAHAQTTLYLTTSGGSWLTEKWVNITDGPNGTGNVLWAQGNGTYGNGAGLVTDAAFTVVNGATYYINCYDSYDDGWDGTTYQIRTSAAGGGILVANNGGISPNDGNDVDASGSWEVMDDERESSEAFSYMPAACLQPSDLTATSITANSASLGWTENGAATTWNVEWGATGFTQGTGTMVTGTTNNPEPITGLSPSTTYQFYVQADCGGAGTSTWVGPFSFTTACGTLNSFPFLETFEAASGSRACWSQIQEVGTGSWTYDIGAGGGAITTAQSGSLNARFVSLNGVNSPITKLVSPTFDLTSLTSPELSFYYGQELWSPDQNQLKVYYRISSTDPWVQIAHYTADVAAWTQQTLTLPNASATYQIAFEGINNWGRANVVDQVEIKEAPACPDPSTLTATSVTSSSANLGWTENGSASAWNVEWGTTGFTQGTGTMVTGTTNNPESISGLTPETTYDFYVQADCGGSGTSAWVGPFTFTTTCVGPVISSFPWTENFDAVTTPATPCGWIVDNVNADAYTWVTGSNFANSAPNSMQIRWNAAAAANDWSFTPELVLVGGQTYELSFAFAVAGATFPEKLKVMVGSAQNVAGMTDLLFDSTLTNTVFDTAFATFTPASSGSYFIGFHNYSDADMFRVYVDDVTLKEIVADTCSIPSNLTANNITPSSAMLDWTENGNATEWDIEWGFQGFTLGTGNPEHVTAKPYLLDGLSPATAYEYYVRADCGSGDTSLWVGPFMFVTDPCPFVIIDLGNDTTLCSDQSITLNAPFNPNWGYGWSPVGGGGPSNTLDTAALGGNGTYNVMLNVIDFTNGCMYFDAINVTFTTCTGIEETTAVGFAIYPNPSNGTFTIRTSESGIIEVSNLQGKVVYKNTLNSTSQAIDLSENAKGVYFVSITTYKGVEVQKIVIQ